MNDWYVIKSGDKYLVGEIAWVGVYATRKYFARRFTDAAEARRWIRDRLERFRGTIDTVKVVRIRRRAAASAAPAKGGDDAPR